MVPCPWPFTGPFRGLSLALVLPVPLPFHCLCVCVSRRLSACPLTVHPLPACVSMRCRATSLTPTSSRPSVRHVTAFPRPFLDLPQPSHRLYLAPPSVNLPLPLPRPPTALHRRMDLDQRVGDEAQPVRQHRGHGSEHHRRHRRETRCPPLPRQVKCGASIHPDCCLKLFQTQESLPSCV